MEYLKAFRERIFSELRQRNWSRKDLAQRIDIDGTLLNAMLRMERRFNEDQVIAIANALNLEPFRLFTEENLVPESQVKEMVETLSQSKDNYQLVEELIPAACGNLAAISKHSIAGYKVFEKQFLANMFKPFLTRAAGEEMFPLLSPGDLILFNRDPDRLQNPDPNKLYLINLAPGEADANLVMRRVGFSKSDWSLTLFPDNRQFSIETHKMSEKKSILDYVIGIAVWIGKELKE